MRTATTCLMLALLASPALGDGPSFDCDKADGSVEEMICADAELAALDVELDAVWRQAMALSQDSPDLTTYRAEQRGWIKGRNDCWKSDDVRACVVSCYRDRIAEIQARWRLVEARGPFFFVEAANPADEIAVTYFATDPQVAILERGDQTVVAYQAVSASGARYEGRNVTFWTKGDEALVTWGHEAPQQTYRLRTQ